MIKTRHTENISIEKIRPSKLNPRKKDDDDTGLRESIKENGLLQPIGVRPLEPISSLDNPSGYEIIWGERRYLAVKKLKLNLIMCEVIECDEEDADSLRLVENAQRVDMHPLDESELFARMVKRYGSTKEAAKVLGKPAAVVRKMMELGALTDESKRLFREGLFEIEQAMAVATIKDETLQEKAAQDLDSDWGPLPTGDTLKTWIAAYHLDLKLAEWSMTDETLLDDEPSCAKCPNRSKNDLLLFEDLTSSDVCRVKDCFEAKRRAFGHRRVVKLEGSGAHMLREKDVRNGWFDSGTMMKSHDNTKLIDLDSKVEVDGKKVKVRKAYAEVLKDKKLKRWIVVHPDTGKAFEVVERNVLAGKKAKSGKKGPVKTTQNDRYKKEEADRQIKREVRRRVLATIKESTNDPARWGPLTWAAVYYEANIRWWETPMSRLLTSPIEGRSLKKIADWIYKEVELPEFKEKIVQDLLRNYLDEGCDYNSSWDKDAQMVTEQMGFNVKDMMKTTRKQVMKDLKGMKV